MKRILIIFLVLFFSNIAYGSSDFEKDLELAKLGNAGAQFRVGATYLNGSDEVEIDYINAYAWLLRAAEQNHANALYNIGYMYLYGVGVPVNYIKAAEFFNKSKDNGFLPAWHILGIMYYDGAGVEKDIEKAKKYCQKAADGGYKPAEEMLKKGIFDNK